MTLETLRKQIDEINSDLLHLLSKREEISRQIGQLKKERELPIFDRERENEIINSLVKKGVQLHLEPPFVKKVFTLILKHSRKQMKKKSHAG